jgi:meiotic recombination protein REC8
MFGGDELDDPGFGFDDEGNLIDYEPANVNPATPVAPGGSAVPSDAGASARVRQEHAEGRQAAAQVSFA